MQLVLLAAGHGRRFGGLKQLAPIGPRGEAIMDYTAKSALACDFEEIVVVVRADIEDEIAAHVAARWPAELRVTFVCQPPLPGTVQAVLSARPVLRGVFGVANADDLYGTSALSLLRRHFLPGGSNDPSDSYHVLVAYQLRNTVLGGAPVTRAICMVGDALRLESLSERRVQRESDGFVAMPLGREDGQKTMLLGDELVSMNLFGFHARMLDRLELAAQHHDSAVGTELLLPDVVGALVASGEEDVRVVVTGDRCIGITHPEDLDAVRRAFADEQEASPSPAS